MASLITSLKAFFSGDTLFLCIAFVVFFAYAMFMGRGKIISLILAFYPATLLYNLFPFTAKLVVLHGDKLIALNKVCIFLIFLVLLSIIISRYIFSASEYTGSAHLLRTAGLSICGVILLLVFSYSTVDLQIFHDFAPKIDALFTGISKLFYWNVGVWALLAIL